MNPSAKHLGNNLQYYKLWANKLLVDLLYFIMCEDLKATSQTRVRAHAHCTSNALVGGKGGAGPSSLPTLLGGPME